MEWVFDSTDVGQAARARSEFKRAFSRINSAADQQAAEVVFMELVGNAVRHAPGIIRIRLELLGHETRLTVHDQGPGFYKKARLPDDLTAESGRGLFLVSRLAKSVRVCMQRGDGTSVTAVMAA